MRKAKMRRETAMQFGIIVILATILAGALTPMDFTDKKSPPPGKASLLWSVNLDDDPDWKSAKATFDSGSFPSPTVGFVGDKVLFAFQHWKNNVPGSAEEEYKVRDFALATGREMGNHQWPVVHNRQRWDHGSLFPLDGRILIYTGTNLALYSSDWTLQQQKDFVGDVRLSPHGKVVFLRSSDRNQVTDTWLDANSFKELSSLTHSPDHYNSVGDQELVFGRLALPPNKSEILISSGDGSWKSLCECDGIPEFVDAHTLAIIGDRQLMVIDESGKLLFTVPLGKRDGDLRFKTSLHSSRFVFSRGKGKARPPIHEMGFSREMVVSVFDIEKKQEIANLHFSTGDSRAIDSALSEDGTKLAVLKGSILQVYRVPSDIGLDVPQR